MKFVPISSTRIIIMLMLFIFWTACSSPKSERTPVKSIQKVKISAHRAGPASGYPENALETIQRITEIIPGVMVEIDVRLTKDNRLVLLHDDKLFRTTTGDGDLSDFSYEGLKQFYLKDNEGAITKFKIPLLEDILIWSKNEDVFLSLDVKGTKTFIPVIDLVQKIGIKDKVEIITYTKKAAEMVFNYDPKINLSVTVRNEKELQTMLNTGIPPNQLFAFTGLALKDASFYELLHDKGLVVTVGVLGNLDKRAAAQGDDLYQKWQALGIDRFATDRPEEVYKSIN